MTKEMKLEIGGEQRTLRFGTMRTLEDAGEIFTGDPLELLYGISTIDLLQLLPDKKDDENAGISLENISLGVKSPRKQFEIIAAFTYAGLKGGGTQCTPEQAIDWVRDLDFDTGALILSFARSAFSEKKKEETKEAGEAEAQTQEKSQPLEEDINASPGQN